MSYMSGVQGPMGRFIKKTSEYIKQTGTDS